MLSLFCVPDAAAGPREAERPTSCLIGMGSEGQRRRVCAEIGKRAPSESGAENAARALLASTLCCWPLAPRWRRNKGLTDLPSRPPSHHHIHLLRMSQFTKRRLLRFCLLREKKGGSLSAEVWERERERERRMGGGTEESNGRQGRKERKPKRVTWGCAAEKAGSGDSVSEGRCCSAQREAGGGGKTPSAVRLERRGRRTGRGALAKRPPRERGAGVNGGPEEAYTGRRRRGKGGESFAGLKEV